MSARGIALLLFLVALACEGFAWWGLRTVAGRRAFDEMAGIIPMVAAIAGIALALCAAAIFLYSYYFQAR